MLKCVHIARELRKATFEVLDVGTYDEEDHRNLPNTTQPQPPTIAAGSAQRALYQPHERGAPTPFCLVSDLIRMHSTSHRRLRTKTTQSLSTTTGSTRSRKKTRTTSGQGQLRLRLRPRLRPRHVAAASTCPCAPRRASPMGRLATLVRTRARRAWPRVRPTCHLRLLESG